MDRALPFRLGPAELPPLYTGLVAWLGLLAIVVLLRFWLDGERPPQLHAPLRGVLPTAALGLSLILVPAAAVWAYVEYLGHAREPLLALALALALLALAAAVPLAFRRVWTFRTAAEPRREPLPTPAPETPERELAGAVSPRERRRVLAALAASSAGLGAIALLPIRSCGTERSGLFATGFRVGIRLVDEQGRPLRASDVSDAQPTVAYPEPAVGDFNSMALVVRVASAVVAFSRICTHAGCAVSSYDPPTHTIRCPCHTSTFDLARDGAVVAGPAGKPLPSLPIAVDADGLLRIAGELSAPPGPPIG